MKRFGFLTASLTALVLCLAFAPRVVAGPPKKPHIASAKMFGDTAMKGHAKFWQRSMGANKMQFFIVHVKNALPLQTFEVTVNGQVVGSITTNAFGSGKLHLRTGGPGSSEPMPPGFPKLKTGDTISVGPITGVFFTIGPKAKKLYEVRGKLDGEGELAGWVRYREHIKPPGLDRRFFVTIENAAAFEAFDIHVNGEFVGTLTADQSGEGSFDLRTPHYIDPPSNAQPIPADFPTLVKGDVVTVGAMTTTLARKH